jgi:hypothetical protein
MRLPYVIDNQTHVLAYILKGLLTAHKGRSLDVATAYFTIGGLGVVREGIMTEKNRTRKTCASKTRDKHNIGPVTGGFQ